MNSVITPDMSDEDIDWEEIQVDPQNIEITLQTRPEGNNKNKDKSVQSIHIYLLVLTNAIARKKGVSHAERVLRIDCHKVHTVILLANARIRNKWINDELLHVRSLYIPYF